ncbi:MAG: polysulfide reductase NrfD [Cyclobacteriaceae bacterium]|nr:polysulfide reductase NrfD [Cyclobacteriaceae bacterium]
MNFKETTQNLLKELAPTIEKFTWKDWLWTISLSLVILWGMYALYLQIARGHEVTGMRDNVVWGLYVANFIFFIGISYAGAIISGILHLMNLEWRKPIIRIAELITVIATIIGPLYILLCMGRLDRLHYLFIYPRLQSPITWDVIAILTYLVGSVIFLYLTLIRDFSILSTQQLNIGLKRKRIYRFLSLGFKNTSEQKVLLKVSTNIMAIIIIPIAIVVHSVLSWIFGMTLRPGWHSTIFGPYFVLAAVYSGTGVMILAMYFFRRLYGLQRYITKKHFVYLGYIMIMLGAGYGYFTFSEYLTDWYSSEKWNTELIDKLFNWQEYGGLFFFANVAGILLPFIVIGIPKLRTIESITLVSALMVLAMWVKRYLIVVPTLETTLIPMQETRPEYIHYTATWLEWALTFAGIAAFILMFKLASKFIPIIPIWETSESIKKKTSAIDTNVDLKSVTHA